VAGFNDRDSICFHKHVPWFGALTDQKGTRVPFLSVSTPHPVSATAWFSVSLPAYLAQGYSKMPVGHTEPHRTERP